MKKKDFVMIWEGVVVGRSFHFSFYIFLHDLDFYYRYQVHYQVQNWLIEKVPDARKDWKQEEKGWDG